MEQKTRIKLKVSILIICCFVLVGVLQSHAADGVIFGGCPPFLGNLPAHNVTVNDSGGYYNSDNAEDVFQEIGQNISDLWSSSGNPFNQTLNTTDSPTFAGLTLDGNLDMNHNDINNVFEIECENDLSVGNDIQLNDRLEHTGDSDTYLNFNINQIIFGVGGTTILDMISTLATFGVNVTMNQNLTVANTTTTNQLTLVNASYTWDMYIDTNGTLVWEMKP